MADTDARTPDDITFGQGLAELESIVTALESGTLELEDSMERYERGVSLLRGLQSRLTDARQRITVLMGELEPDEDDASSEPG